MLCVIAMLMHVLLDNRANDVLTKLHQGNQSPSCTTTNC
jgi:hypothetical protein